MECLIKGKEFGDAINEMFGDILNYPPFKVNELSVANSHLAFKSYMPRNGRQ